MRSLYELTVRMLETAFGWLLFTIGALVWGFVFVPITLLLDRFWPGARELLQDLTRAGMRFYIGVLPILQLRVEGRESAPDGTRILVVNHQSWLDSIVMISLEPRVSGPARAYILRVPLVRSVLRLAGFYPAEAGDPAPLARMRAGADRTRETRGALLFFPEGSRSKTGQIGSFQRGAFRLAYDCGLPIQPVVIDGLHEVLPPGTVIAQRAERYPVRVRYLEPLAPPFGVGSRRQVVRELSERVRLSMIEELERLRGERAGAEGVGEPRTIRSTLGSVP